ncbi:hypothetical protein KUV62_10290 [Salipiger bermudensis]|uniref:hypothetical protein n=1 Tax=Salipiger bermudensis TaxID=344736 RepID=UPI001C9A2250|nr:hypothetical protein [Salipiger bermudensis]MBY6004299.1 hypothetical protein [Salipiger bermudensis]
MKQLAALCLSASLLAMPVAAQDAGEEAPDGGGLMKRGAQMFFEGLMGELDPALRGLEDLAGEMEPALRSFREEMGPALQDLMGKVKDWSVYHPPEMLENGDIILRRREPLESEDDGILPRDRDWPERRRELPPLDGTPPDRQSGDEIEL